MTKLLLGLLGVIVIIGGGVWVFNIQKGVERNNPVACTEEAKLCSDGSAVGRTGPNCEFAPCPTTETSTVVFNRKVTILVGAETKFSDGLNIFVKEINDSRCKSGVQCIWAGELSANLIVTGGKFTTAQEVRLGTINNQNVSLNGYKFTLDSATEKDVTVVVKEEAVVSGGGTSRIAAGYVAGHVTIGPFCPVESIDHPCTISPEAYTSRFVIIYQRDGITEKERTALDKEGNYKITLGPGKYFAQIQPAGIGPGEKKSFTVLSFQTTTVDFDIDTGIR